jgi:hypothetical protein
VGTTTLAMGIHSSPVGADAGDGEADEDCWSAEARARSNGIGRSA